RCRAALPRRGRRTFGTAQCGQGGFRGACLPKRGSWSRAYATTRGRRPPHGALGSGPLCGRRLTRRRTTHTSTRARVPRSPLEESRRRAAPLSGAVSELGLLRSVSSALVNRAAPTCGGSTPLGNSGFVGFVRARRLIRSLRAFDEIGR